MINKKSNTPSTASISSPDERASSEMVNFIASLQISARKKLDIRRMIITEAIVKDISYYPKVQHSWEYRNLEKKRSTMLYFVGLEMERYEDKYDPQKGIVGSVEVKDAHGSAYRHLTKSLCGKYINSKKLSANGAEIIGKKFLAIVETKQSVQWFENHRQSVFGERIYRVLPYIPYFEAYRTGSETLKSKIVIREDLVRDMLEIYRSWPKSRI